MKKLIDKLSKSGVKTAKMASFIPKLVNNKDGPIDFSSTGTSGNVDGITFGTIPDTVNSIYYSVILSSNPFKLLKPIKSVCCLERELSIELDHLCNPTVKTSSSEEYEGLDPEPVKPPVITPPGPQDLPL